MCIDRCYYTIRCCSLLHELFWRDGLSGAWTSTNLCSRLPHNASTVVTAVYRGRRPWLRLRSDNISTGSSLVWLDLFSRRMGLCWFLVPRAGCEFGSGFQIAIYLLGQCTTSVGSTAGLRVVSLRWSKVDRGDVSTQRLRSPTRSVANIANLNLLLYRLHSSNSLKHTPSRLFDGRPGSLSLCRPAGTGIIWRHC